MIRLPGLLLALVSAVPADAAEFPEELPSRLAEADIVIMGEVHDNPAHHLAQARMISILRPEATVWEMLTPEQAARVPPRAASPVSDWGDIFGWEAAGWPAFEFYAPIFEAAGNARIVGAAVPRSAIRAHLEADPIAIFGPDAEVYGLNESLPLAQQAARMELQWEAHCQALPEETLAPMVDIQRVRDATLARAAINAIDRTGGPVAVITGNGHARTDWGVPFYIASVRPDLDVFSIGQTEDGAALSGAFDIVLDAPAVPRGDPCAAFR